MSNTDWSIIVLAGGKGTRIASLGPKPLIKLFGRALVEPILNNASLLAPYRTIVAVSEVTKEVARQFANDRREFCQVEPLGTGYTVLELINRIKTPFVLIAQADDSYFLIKATLESLMAQHQARNADFTLGAAQVSKPCRYAHIERDGKRLIAICKQPEDLSKAPPKEVVTGLYAGKVDWLREILPQIKPNLKGEVGLPSVVEIGQAHGDRIDAFIIPEQEWQGINTPEELALAEQKIN